MALDANKGEEVAMPNWLELAATKVGKSKYLIEKIILP